MANGPNILLILTDQQRTDSLGFMGRTPCHTPNMDRIASEGISFDRAICSSPLCLPSRASIFTGQYPHQVDMMRNSDTLRVHPTLTDKLKARGYYTAYAGKWHLEPSGGPRALKAKAKELGLSQFQEDTAPTGQRVVDRWFDVAEGQSNADYSEWCEQNGLPDGWPVSDADVRTHRTPSMTTPKTKVQDLPPDKTYAAWVTDIALRFFRDRPRNQPFFLVSSWFGPHPPFLIPEPYYSMYDFGDIPEPPNFGPQTGAPRSNRTNFYHQLFLDHGDDWEAWKQSMAVYWGYVTMQDALVGRLLQALEDGGVLDDTLVIFASDHGEMLGSHGQWHKMMPYEENLRVPLLMRYPKAIQPGLRSTALSSLIDIPATILSILGEEIPGEYESRDLSAAFADGSEFQQDAYRFSEHQPLGDWHNATDFRLVVDERYKYVWNNDDVNQLFDLQNDPFELVNLHDDPDTAEQLTRLRDRLHRWVVDTDDPLLPQFAAQSGIS